MFPMLKGIVMIYGYVIKGKGPEAFPGHHCLKTGKDLLSFLFLEKIMSGLCLAFASTFLYPASELFR